MKLMDVAAGREGWGQDSGAVSMAANRICQSAPESCSHPSLPEAAAAHWPLPVCCWERGLGGRTQALSTASVLLLGERGGDRTQQLTDMSYLLP